MVDMMDGRLAGAENPWGLGKALSGPLGTLWSFGVGTVCLIYEVQEAAKRIIVLRLGKQGES